MKNLLHISLSMLLLLATTGVSLSKHYCMGRLKAVKLSHEKPTFCCLADEAEDEGCCNGESEFINLDEDFTPAFSLEMPELEWSFMSSPLYSEEALPILAIHFSHPEAHAPPLISTPRFILHGVLLI